MKRIIFTLLATVLTAQASSFVHGKKLFAEKCSSCHADFIPADTLKENFFEKNNTLLHLKAPTVNMLAYAIMDSPKHIGDPSDPEMRSDEIVAYLEDTLTHPHPENTICDPNFMKFYDVKKPISPPLTEDEYETLSAFFMQYKAERKKHNPRATKRLTSTYDITKVLQEAKQTHKHVLLEAMSPTCHFCKKMEREVIETEAVQKVLGGGYIMIQINVDAQKFPLGLGKVYKHVTPSFFILDANGSLAGHYPGSWNKQDFLSILKHYTPKEETDAH